MIFLVYCNVSLFSCIFFLASALRDIFHTPMTRYSLFVVKTNKPNQYSIRQFTDIDQCDCDTVRYVLCSYVTVVFEQKIPNKHELSCRYMRHHPIFYIKPVKQELMYLNPPISMFHDVVSESEMALVRRLARPRVTDTHRPSAVVSVTQLSVTVCRCVCVSFIVSAR